jgi:hypothetical protein
MYTIALWQMSTQNVGRSKLILPNPDGKRKLDVEWDPFTQKYVVKVRGGKNCHGSATQFGAFFRKWLLRQRESPSSEV